MNYLQNMDLSERIANSVRTINIKPNDSADRKYEIIVEQIKEFQDGLSDELDVCVQLASFGSSILMYVTDIGYQNPDVLYFWGHINGNKAQLIQHMSQLNFLLMAVKKEKPEDKPKRIGFLIDEE